MSDVIHIEDARFTAAQIAKVEAEAAKILAEKEKILKESEFVPRQLRESLWLERLKIIGSGLMGVVGFVTAAGTILVAGEKVDLAESRVKNAGEQLAVIEAAASAASAAATLARVQADAATKKRDEAVLELERTEEALQQTREALTNEAKMIALARETKASVPPAGKLVYIQFRGNLARDAINDLRGSLKKVGSMCLAQSALIRIIDPSSNIINPPTRMRQRNC